MTRFTLALAGLVGLVACSGGRKTSAAGADSLARDLQLAPAESSHALSDTATPTPRDAAPQLSPSHPPAATHRRAHPAPVATSVPAGPAATPSPAAAAPLPVAAERSLASGTTIPATLQDSINSRHDKPGRVITARVASDVTDPNGRVVIPAGAAVQLTITQLAPATSKSQADGKLAFHVDGILLQGTTQAISAEVQPVAHDLKGRGVTAGEAEKVGVGTAIGAVLGRILGGGGKGTVIGGVVGAAGGTAVAVQTASRDVVVRAGTPVTIVLSAPLVVKAP